nr:hypothetical protein [Stenotrophobium rhamnosiphilum]
MKFNVLMRVVLLCAVVSTPLALAQDATSLKARHAALREQLTNNPFKRPLYLESSQTSGGLKGETYAVIEQPYAVVSPALKDINHWCDILILHQNVKSCSAGSSKSADMLQLSVGRKFDQPLDDAFPIDFHYKVVTNQSDYQQLLLTADEGPMGTSRYRIQLEVVALDAQRSFLHLSYSYRYGMAARVAMQGYLTTTGRNKLGFSIVSRKANGEPVYMRGVRGVVERNTMRYFLAIEAYLGALSAPASEQLEKRLNAWYAGVERYPQQLHELERGEYLDMKHKEIQRQQTLQSATSAK